jgi:1,2-diacylglycerol 3-alpha-glucosyltransferase
MRIGIVAYWFNRGQGVVARHLRSAFDELGHETFVLARPTRASNLKPAFVDREGVWDQPRVTAASAYEVPWTEYEAWAEANSPDVVFFDQNYQLAEIARLRRSGVRTVGRFVWEAFSPEHVAPATEAMDVIYSLTRAERERYATLGIDSPLIPWGCPPELLRYAKDRLATSPPAADAGAEQPAEIVTFFYPGGFMSARKPFEIVLQAFSRTGDPRLRLVFKAQVGRGGRKVKRRARRDDRIEVISDDLPTPDYLRLFARCDVCLAPSRWEGLGLHLYEATAFGMPIITNDNPPMNELVTDGRNGLLVPGHPAGEAKSGIPAFEPDVGELAQAIERLADDELRERLASGALERRDELRWERTVAALGELVDRVGAARAEAGS